MRRTTIKHRKNFLATDSFGNTQTLCHWQEVHHHVSGLTEGISRVTLPNGTALGKMSNGKYINSATGEIYTTDDPNAP